MRTKKPKKTYPFPKLCALLESKLLERYENLFEKLQVHLALDISW